MLAPWHDFPPTVAVEDVIDLWCPYGMAYSFPICSLNIMHRYRFSCIWILTKRLQERFLFCITQVPVVSVIVAFCDTCKTVGFISGNQHGNILRVEAGFFTNFFVLLPFCSHLKCCQPFFNILVSILFPRSLDFLRFLKRERVSFHFSSPSSLYINSDKLSTFLKRH